MNYKLIALTILLPILLGILTISGNINNTLSLIVIILFIIFLCKYKLWKYLIIFILTIALSGMITYKAIEIKNYNIEHRFKYEYKMDTDVYKQLEKIQKKLLSDDTKIKENGFEKSNEETEINYSKDYDKYLVKIAVSEEFIEVSGYDSSMQYSLMLTKEYSSMDFYNNDTDFYIKFKDGVAKTDVEVSDKEIIKMNETNEKIVDKVEEIV